MINKNKIDMLDGVLVVMVAILGNLAMQGVISFISVIAGVAGNVGSGNVAPDTLSPPSFLTSSMFNLVAMFFLQMVFMAAPIIYFSIVKKKQPLLTIKMNNRTKPINYVFATILAVLCLVTFYLPTGWFGELLNKIGYRSLGGVQLNSALEIVFGIVLMVIIAPFFEEIIFRGYLLSGLSNRFSDIKAVLLSGLAFSLMHMNPEQTVYQFFLGCVCAFAAIKTKNLILPVIIHGASNLCALLMDLTALGTVVNKAIAFATSTWYFSVLFTVGLLAIGGAAIFIIIKFMGKTTNKVMVSSAPLATPAPTITAITDTDAVLLNNNQPQFNISNEQVQEFAQSEPIKQAEIQKKRNKIAVKVLFGVIAICLLVWLMVFVSQVIVLPTAIK